jgi:CYTH domain-containing protein
MRNTEDNKMKEQELERVFLLKRLPEDLFKHKMLQIKVGDFFESNNVDTLKIRQKGDKFELIKKEGKTAYERTENKVPINRGEFEALWGATVQNHEKIRILYPLGKYICEIDLYQGKLNGYVRAEVEFSSSEEMKSFIPPEWFGEDITKLNHGIHEDLGLVSFEDMERRFSEHKIRLLRLIPPVSKSF